MKHALVTAGITALIVGTSHATEIADYTVVTESSSFGAAETRTLLAACPAGTIPIGGGAQAVGGGGARPVLRGNEAYLGTVDGWRAEAWDDEFEEAGGWRLTVTAICGNLEGVIRDTIETTFFGLRKISSTGCSLDEVAVSGGANGAGTDVAVLQRSISEDSETWGGTVRSHDNPNFTLRVSVLCAPADDDISRLSLSSTTNTALTKELSIVCPEGRSVLGGGAEAAEDEGPLIAGLTTNAPLFDDGKIIGWRAAAHARQGAPPPWRLDVAVVCPEPAHASIALVALAWRARRLRGAASSRALATPACHRP